MPIASTINQCVRNTSCTPAPRSPDRTLVGRKRTSLLRAGHGRRTGAGASAAVPTTPSRPKSAQQSRTVEPRCSATPGGRAEAAAHRRTAGVGAVVGKMSPGAAAADRWTFSWLLSEERTPTATNSGTSVQVRVHRSLIPAEVDPVGQHGASSSSIARCPSLPRHSANRGGKPAAMMPRLSTSRRSNPTGTRMRAGL